MDIRRSNGNLLMSLADGTKSQNLPLTFAGYNYAGYGKVVNENFLALLENFASDIPPVGAQVGQLWYDTLERVLKVKDSDGFKPFIPTTVSGEEPELAAIGDQWWDTRNDQLKVYDGNEWILIAPAFSRVDGKSGITVEHIVDTEGTPRLVSKISAEDLTVAVISHTSDFTWADPDVGYVDGDIKMGINVNPLLTEQGFTFHGTVADSNKLGGVDAEQYARKDLDTDFEKNLSVAGSLTLSGQAQVSIDSSGNLVLTNNQDVLIGNDDGVLVSIKADGQIEVGVAPTQPGSLTNKNYVDQEIDSLVNSLDVRFTAAKDYTDQEVALVRSIADNNMLSIAGLSSQISSMDDQLSAKANIDSPVLTGVPRAPTPAQGTDTTQIATAGFVMAQDALRKAYIDEQLGLNNENSNSIYAQLRAYADDGLSTKADKNSPTLTGVPLAPTPALSAVGQQIATVDFVRTAVESGLWQGSSKFVSTSAPTNSQGENGDFWFRYQ